MLVLFRQITKYLSVVILLFSYQPKVLDSLLPQMMPITSSDVWELDFETQKHSKDLVKNVELNQAPGLSHVQTIYRLIEEDAKKKKLAHVVLSVCSGITANQIRDRYR